jgi:hypothetical protein
MASDAVQDDVAAALSAFLTSTPTRPQRSFPALVAPIEQSSEQVYSDRELDAVSQMHEIVSGFTELLDKSTALSALGLGGSWNHTRDALSKALSSTCRVHSERYGAQLDGYASTASLEMARSQVRIHLLASLTELCQRLAALYRDSLLEAFQKTMAKLPATASLRGDLQQLRRAAEEKYQQALRSMRRDLASLLQTECTSPLLDSSRLHLQTDASSLLRQFSLTLQTLSAQQVARLTVQGAFNPFVRTLPFPPLHVNLNYLFYPQLRPVLRKDLYDVHVAGVQERRAEPLRFEGAAQVPFDPNQCPKSTEDKQSNFEILKNFLTMK